MPSQANILYSTWTLEPLLKVEPHDNGPLFVEVHALLALGRQKSMISWRPRCCGNNVSSFPSSLCCQARWQARGVGRNANLPCPRLFSLQRHQAAVPSLRQVGVAPVGPQQEILIRSPAGSVRILRKCSREERSRFHWPLCSTLVTRFPVLEY